MNVIRKLGLFALCVVIMLVFSCDFSNNSHSSSTSTKESLTSGRHYYIDNVNTGWTASGNLMKPFVEFDIVNNGTEDVSVITLIVLFWTPGGLASQSERMGSEQSRVITNFASGDREHYRYVCSNGYNLQDGAWNRMTTGSFFPAEVGIGIMYQSQTRVSQENIDQYIINNDNVE